MMFPRPVFRSSAVLLAAMGLLVWGHFSAAEDFQGSTHQLPYDEEPIQYSKREANDPITDLQGKIARGEVKLRWDDKFGYLPGILEVLGIPASSQTLVFSKTSLQRSFITPSNPRALFYNDDVYVGYIPGAPVMEISAVDPKLGAVFYTIEQEKVRKPRFTRDADCLRCHGSSRSLGVPGHVLRSIATDETGELDSTSETDQVNQCTPIADRWAGWYVTGIHGAQPHRGNLVGSAAFARHEKEPNYLGNLASLKDVIDADKYLRPTSDIVSLMVLEHQTHMHNYITRLNFETQSMMQTYGHVRYLKNQVNGFLRYLLFTEEVPLTSPMSGDETFIREFAASGPRDSKGRSLRDFDLQKRIFKYPCSFLIYSKAFDELPEVMRSHLLERLHKILIGEDKDPQFANIAPEDRAAILDILKETKPNLPDYWKQS